MKRARAALGLLLMLYVQGRAAGCSNVSALSQQLDSLLAEYDRGSAPAQPARVRLVFDLRHAAMRQDGTVHFLADLTLSWHDPRIVWNASEWGCESVLASPDRLWLPAVELLNGAGTAQASLNVRAAHDGALAWVQRFDAAVPVTLELRDWPEDVQTAVFKFGSRTQLADELDLLIDDILPTVVFEAGEWELLSPLAGGVSTTGGRRLAAWAVRLRRRAAAHEAAASAVLTSAVLLLVAAIALPASTRPPLCACASFTATLWLVSAALRVPGGASAPRALGVMCAVCVCAAAAAAAAAVAARLAARASQPPAALRALAATAGRCCNLAPSEETCAQAQVGAWAVLGTLLDYVLCAALLLALFICICVYL
ncbi:unnamed protein product [Chilo suppressalis]|uniref:Neurotransmitter-gated ion-channel ligand-binding domain-containing protein n=1 Tax=Chilo suppressalis TaxID=168631 RepID=A0ABN8ECD8_CHISP|nr:unnamed protein product [Chilo suppressalis]